MDEAPRSLTDEEIVTTHVGAPGSTGSVADSGDDTGDVTDTSDTGDDAGDVSDTSDTGDDS